MAKAEKPEVVERIVERLEKELMSNMEGNLLIDWSKDHIKYELDAAVKTSKPIDIAWNTPKVAPPAGTPVYGWNSPRRPNLPMMYYSLGVIKDNKLAVQAGYNRGKDFVSQFEVISELSIVPVESLSEETEELSS